MERRGPDWIDVYRFDNGFAADCSDYGWIPGWFEDAFSAWVGADEWYKANVEATPSSSTHL